MTESRSHDIGTVLGMNYLSVDCDSFAVVVPVTCVEVDVTGSEAMLALSLCTLYVKCLMKRLGRSALG